jgi:hypothetical protein
MTRKLLLLSLFLICICNPEGYSQEMQRFAFVSSASAGSNSTTMLQTSIGELMVETYSGGSNIITQGFLQHDQFPLNIEIQEATSGNIKVFPNPVNSLLNIEFSFSDPGTFSVDLFDLLGKHQQMQGHTEKTTSSIKLDLGNIPAGIYFLRISSSNGQFTEIFKISKI